MRVHAFLGLLLHLRHFPALVLHPLRCLVLLLHMHMPYPCMMHLIQGFWWSLARAEVHQLPPGRLLSVPRAGGESKVGFPVRPKIAPCLRGGGRGKSSAGQPSKGAGWSAHFLGGGTKWSRRGAVTPSLHPEIPGIQFVSPGYGLDIRQSMGWTKVCGNHTVGNLGAKG